MCSHTETKRQNSSSTATQSCVGANVQPAYAGITINTFFSHLTKMQMSTCGYVRGARVKCGHSRCRLRLRAVWERFARPVGAEPVGF